MFVKIDSCVSKWSAFRNFWGDVLANSRFKHPKKSHSKYVLSFQKPKFRVEKHPYGMNCIYTTGKSRWHNSPLSIWLMQKKQLIIPLASGSWLKSSTLVFSQASFTQPKWKRRNWRRKLSQAKNGDKATDLPWSPHRTHRCPRQDLSWCHLGPFFVLRWTQQLLEQK